MTTRMLVFLAALLLTTLAGATESPPCCLCRENCTSYADSSSSGLRATSLCRKEHERAVSLPASSAECQTLREKASQCCDVELSQPEDRRRLMKCELCHEGGFPGNPAMGVVVLQYQSARFVVVVSSALKIASIVFIRFFSRHLISFWHCSYFRFSATA